MSEYTFRVVDICADRYAASPGMLARIAIEAPPERQVHAMALRAQVRIEPQRRGYDDAEAGRLASLFGARERWSQTLRPLVWMHAHATVPGFTGSGETDLVLPCTYDFEVVGSRYLNSLEEGPGESIVPLDFMFSGTIFTKGERGFGVERVPWDCDARFELPVSVWRETIDAHYPGTGWIRLDHDVIEALAEHRTRHGHTSWEETLSSLLGREAVSP